MMTTWKILVGFVAFLAAVLAIFRPQYDAHQKRMNDLIGDRNLAYIAWRVVDPAMEQRWKMMGQLEFKTSEVALDAIHFNEISPTSLSTYFVELWHMTKRAEELVNHGYEKPEMSPETVRSRAKHAWIRSIPI